MIPEYKNSCSNKLKMTFLHYQTEKNSKTFGNTLLDEARRNRHSCTERGPAGAEYDITPKAGNLSVHLRFGTAILLRETTVQIYLHIYKMNVKKVIHRSIV